MIDMDKHTNRPAAAIGLAAIVSATLCCVTIVSATEPPAVLFVGEHDNHVAAGLRALQVPLDEASPDDLIQGRFCLFDYSVLVFGIDVPRTNLESMREAVGGFVETGGAVLCFRASEPDPWLPVALAKDRAYAFGELLAAEHPIFNKPHAMDRAALQAVHGGSIYSGFYAMGEGWRPLASAGRQQAWDKVPSAHSGDHYGIIELEHGRGRIVMCQMIPAYAWLNDSKGDANSPGAHLFENLVRYALASAVRREGPRRPRVRPEGYAAELGELLKTQAGWDRLRLDDPGWHFTATGPFRGNCDRRGVYTIAHGNDPAGAGNFGKVARQLQIPEGAQRVMLRVYQSDDYCGGQEPKMVGDERVSTSVNMKEAYRFRQVLIDDNVVAETDVLGRNVQPARDRVQWYDITDMVHGKREVTLSLQVVDRKDTGEEPFATDCYFACVDLRTDFLRMDASSLTASGYVKDNQGMALAKTTGSLSLTSPVPEGQYVVAFRLLDHPYGQGSARITAGGQRAAAVRASADDFRFWWLATGPLALAANAEIALETEGDGEERMVVSEVAFIPADLCEREAKTTVAESPIFKPGPLAEHEIVKLTVLETARATRTREIATQAVPFGFGRLRSAEQIAVSTSDGKMISSQASPFAHWPDGSIQSAAVTFPVDVTASGKAEYGLHFGTRVDAIDVPEPLVVKESAGHFTIDTGRLLVEIPRDTGQVVSAVSVDGREVAVPTDRSWGLELEGEDGRLLRSDGKTTTSCVLAERGPLRAIVVKTGKLSGDEGVGRLPL